jgi:hypothetical protein
LTNVFLPKVKEFGLQMDVFMKDLIEMKEAIRLFDETICIKASKSNLLEL